MDLDLLMRYTPLVEYLETHASQGARILEVGSGSFGITRFYKRRIVGLDISFPPPISPYLEPHHGNVTAIPFPDSSFDFVLCMDVLEHLSRNERGPAIREMWRLARKAVLCGLPCGVKTSTYEEKYNTAFKQRFGRDNPWLAEHKKHRLPEVVEIRQLWLQIAGDMPGVRIEEIRNVNLDFWLQTHLEEQTKPWPASYRKLREAAMRNPGEFTRQKSFGDCYRRIFIVTRTDQLAGMGV